MSSADYWKKREQEAKKATIRDEEEYRKRIETIYKQTYEAVERQINDWYARYASKNGLSMSEARMRVKKLDMERYERLAAKYVATHDFSDQANEEMEIYNLTMRINRLELLKAQINLELLAGYDDLDKELEREFIEQAMKEDRRLAGILGDSVIGNQRYAKQIVNASFWNATYSERIWGNNMPRLRSSIETQLRNGIIQGIHSTELARNLRKSFDVSIRDSERLMITEVRRIQTEIQKDSFDRNGFKEYRFISAGDGRVCPECERLHGQHFKVGEMQPGENAPPMHPLCRCSTAAYMDGDKYKRWLDALERGEDVRWKDFEAAPKDIESYGDNSKTDIDYASAYTFAEGETKLVNKLLSGKPSQICDAVEEILNKDKYSLPDSHWSKRTYIGRMDDMKGILGRKEYNCDITIREDQLYNVKTYIHENLHARSISRYDRKHRKDVYEIYKRIEEGTVEYLSQEICKKSNLPYSVSYSKRVDALRELRELIAPDMNDYDFAKKLIEIPTAKRYNYLEGKTKRVKEKSSEEIRNRIKKNLFALRPIDGR